MRSRGDAEEEVSTIRGFERQWRVEMGRRRANAAKRESTSCHARGGGESREIRVGNLGEDFERDRTQNIPRIYANRTYAFSFLTTVRFVWLTVCHSGCIIVLSGAVDYVSDGHSVIVLSNGHPLLGQITGAGCILGTAIATFCGASSMAAERDASDPGLGVIVRGNMLAAAASGSPDLHSQVLLTVEHRFPRLSCPSAPHRTTAAIGAILALAEYLVKTQPVSWLSLAQMSSP